MTSEQIQDARLFFKSEVDTRKNCARHPEVAHRKATALLADNERLRDALKQIEKHSFQTEDSGQTWRDVAMDHALIAAEALRDVK